MNRKKISICIPTYNFGRFIAETLESIVREANDQVEVVIGDGGSTDDTAQVVAEYQARFAGITYRNFGKKGGIDLDVEKTVSLASGEYVWLMSSDDTLEPGALARLLAEINSGADIYLLNRVECDISMNHASERFWLGPAMGSRDFDFATDQTLREYLGASGALGALFSYISSIVVRKDRWDAAQGSEAFFGTHYAHVHRLFAIGRSGGCLRYVKPACVRTRLGNDSFLAGGLAKRLLIDFRAYQAFAEKHFPEPDLRRAFKRVMQREHKWYNLINLRSKITDPADLREIGAYLEYFEYAPLKIGLIECVGRSGKVVVILRALHKIARQAKARLSSACRAPQGAPLKRQV